MLASKRVRKQSTKYSDFVKIPIKKRKKVVNDEANGTNNQDIHGLKPAKVPPDVPEQATATPAPATTPYILTALSSLLHSCPHHDVLVTTADHALVPCHALMLSQASPVLSELLREQVVEEGGMMRLVLENMNMDQLSCFLDFVYTGQTRPFVGLDLIERFGELRIVFTAEVCEEFKADTEDFKVNDMDEDSLDIAGDCGTEHQLDAIEDRKNTIVQAIASLENKENQVEDNYEYKVRPGGLNKFCNYCAASFNTFVLLKRHVRDHHGMVYGSFLDSYGLLKPFKCESCADDFKTFLQLKTHVEKSHRDIWDRFCSLYRNHDCSKCDKTFFTRAEMRKHERKIHKNFKTKQLPSGKYVSGRPVSVNIDDGLPGKCERKCEICSKICPNAEKFTDHMNAHIQGKKPYSCELCEFKCATRKNLRKHSALHIVSDTLLLCNVCGIVFHSQYDLKKHRKEIHSQKILGIKKQKAPKSKTVGDFICEKCGQHFHEQQKYNSHLKFSHVSEDDKFQCPHCPHKSITPFSLKMHQALHFPPTLPCEQCGKLFHTKLYLTRHIKQNHAEDSEKDYQCAQCGKGFVTRDSYEGHLSMHAGVKPIQCRYCEMRYQNRSNAIAHEKKVHKDLYTRKAKSLGGVRVKDRMAGKEIIGFNKIPSDSFEQQALFYIVDHEKSIIHNE